MDNLKLFFEFWERHSETVTTLLLKTLITVIIVLNIIFALFDSSVEKADSENTEPTAFYTDCVYMRDGIKVCETIQQE